jgi:hypothetical protein
MIPFFRKIRKKMADDNRPLKYMRYAIGEIVLVVIGILIALQINTWNEERKERLLENEILSDLLVDLNKDLVQMKESTKNEETTIECLRSIAYALENNLPMTDNLKSKFYSIAIPFGRISNESTYENLKSIGFGIITNKTIRKGIQDLNSYYKMFDKGIDLFNTEFMLTMNEQQAEHLMVNMGNYPRDYESLKDNFLFINTVHDMANMHGYHLQAIREIIPKLNILISAIENELAHN